MVSDQEFAALKAQVEALSKQLLMKVLGNDPSTNLGLTSQAISFGGPPQAGSLTLQLNGVETSINNSVDPDLGQTTSLESEDISVPNGDKSAITPNGFAVLVWDGAAYQTVAFVGENSSSGALILTDLTGNTITLDTAIPQMQISNGLLASGLFPDDIIVGNQGGVSGVFVAGAVTITVHKGIIVSIV